MCDSCATPEVKKTVDFVHLHNHSEYSLLDGLSSVSELAKTASSLNFPAIALTDHGSCGGLYSFQKECIKNKIKPILGAELYITKDHWNKDKSTKTNHILLLAKDEIGLKNLFQLSSIAEIEGKYRKPRIDMDLLQKYHKGIICTSGCPASEIPMAISQGNIPQAKELMGKYKELFKDDFYVEIMTHKYFNNPEQEQREISNAKQLLELAKEFNVKALATNDVHYARKDQWADQDLMLSMQTGDTIKNPDRFTFGSDEFYIKTYDEMLMCYKERPDILANTMEISDKVQSGLIKRSEDLLPHFDIPEGYADEKAYLKDLVRDGMARMGFMDKQVYRDRIKFEMNAIITCGYTRYFLILWDIINFAKGAKINIGIGRGSGGGSLCLYVLGIVKIDPIKYNLLFERFINPERVSPPDVDIDFDYYRRDEIFNYITRKYSRDNCSKIGTYGSLGAKAVIRYASKALDLGNDWEAAKKMQEKGIKGDPPKKSLFIADAISKTIPYGPDMTIESAMKSKDGEEFKNYMERYPKLYGAAKRLEGKYNSAGVHAAGIVVCKDNIIDHIPLRERDGVICSQFDKIEVEDLGLLKFDCLGLKTVAVIYNTTDEVNKRYNKNIKIDDLEPNDPNVFKLLRGGYSNMDNRGIFQFESPGMMKLLRGMNVDSIGDMIAANALYRPGPLGAKVHELYCDYKNGTKEIKPLHPKMGEILKDTYSLICYQEDFMKISQELAGFTKGQSDTLRKAVGKKDMDLMAKQKDSFVAGCVKNGVEKSIAEEIFKQIEYFGGYGFNKSHSAAYSLLAYQTSWLKIYYPLEFMCHLLTSELGNDDKHDIYLQEAKRMGLDIRPPQINNSKSTYVIVDTQRNGKKYSYMVAPFTSVKGVGDVAVENIVACQPFSSFRDFIQRVEGRKVNIKVFNALVDAGCMDDIWGLARPQLKEQFEQLREMVNKEKKAKLKQEKYIEEMTGGGGDLFERMANTTVEWSGSS